MDIGDESISVAVPSEILHSREEFFAALQEAGREQHPLLLQNFGVKSTSGVPFVSAQHQAASGLLDIYSGGPLAWPSMRCTGEYLFRSQRASTGGGPPAAAAEDIP